ncbi:zinc transport system substrate-binding protein [Lachnospiraceae bacterium C7]|nr:zinc transport system substrate-binding protein [Lachnospiraceae bacterium C7]
MKKKYLSLFLILLCTFVFSVVLTVLYVNSTTQVKHNNKKTIVASFYPIYIAALNITDGVDVELKNLSEPKTGCLHDYQLTTADMKLISKSDIFIVNGGGIEGFLSNVVKEYPKVEIIDSTKGLNLIKEGDDKNAHAWMSVKKYRQQVKEIANQLCKLDPDNASKYKKNLKIYDKKLEKLQNREAKIQQQIATNSRNIIIFHEAFAYVADDLDLDVKYVLDLDEERQVSAGEVADVLGSIKKDNVSYILAEKLYAKDMGDTVEKESNVKVIYIDPLNRGEYDKDSYIKGMNKNLDKLQKVYTSSN